jgi:hypothetical protein
MPCPALLHHHKCLFDTYVNAYIYKLAYVVFDALLCPVLRQKVAIALALVITRAQTANFVGSVGNSGKT